MLHVVAIHGKINGCNSSGLKGIGEKMSRPKIVIVGAGFGGLAAAEVGCRRGSEECPRGDHLDRPDKPPRVSATALPGGDVGALEALNRHFPDQRPEAVSGNLAFRQTRIDLVGMQRHRDQR
jgi:hypothetical protein